jgi:hypothetical protein
MLEKWNSVMAPFGQINACGGVHENHCRSQLLMKRGNEGERGEVWGGERGKLGSWEKEVSCESELG